MALIVQAQFSFLSRVAIDPPAVALAVMLGTFGTGYFHYASFDASFSHAYSGFWAMMTLTAFNTDRRMIRLILTTICACVLILTRNTNILLLPLVAVLRDWLQQIEGDCMPSTVSLRIGRVLVGTVALCAYAAPGELVQIALNSWYEGRLTLSSYQSFGTLAFNITHLPDIILSYERGLVTYYPGMLVMWVILLVVPVTRKLAVIITGVILAYALLYKSWPIWTLGSGFGHRGFVGMVPLMAIPVAVALSRIRNSRLVALASLVAIAWCQLLMTAYWRGFIPFGGTTRAQYWAALISVARTQWLPYLILLPAVAVGGLYARRTAHVSAVPLAQRSAAAAAPSSRATRRARAGACGLDPPHLQHERPQRSKSD